MEIKNHGDVCLPLIIHTDVKLVRISKMGLDSSFRVKFMKAIASMEIHEPQRTGYSEVSCPEPN